MTRDYKGIIPSPPDARDWHIDRCMDMPVGSASFPKTYSVPWLPDYKDQDMVNSCSAYVLAVICECIWYKKHGEKILISTGYSYGDRTFSEYKGEGAIPRDVLKTVCEHGSINALLWDNNFEVPKAIEVFEAAYPHLAEFAKMLIKSFIRIRGEDEAKAHLLKYGIPLFASAQIRYVNPLSKSKDYHALAVTGWLRNGDFKCRNSWGMFNCPNPEIEFENFNEIWGVIPMEDVKFTDVAEDRWSAEAINEAVKDGIVAGFPDGTFAPDQPLTREQIAVIWSRIKRYCTENFEKNL